MATSEERADRHALARVLAGEGRNAVARIELVASELARLDDHPVRRTRIEAIRSAAEEIEGLLAKIDLVSTLPAASAASAPTTDAARVVEGVLGRLEPSLVASGLSIRSALRQGGRADLPLALGKPEVWVESVCFEWLRLIALEAEGPTTLEIDAQASEGQFVLTARCARGPGGPLVPDRLARVELDVLLSEAEGRLRAFQDEERTVWQLRLPLDGTDGAA